MAEPILATEKEDVVISGQRKVVCDGPSFSKHPRVFLTMVDDAKGKPSHVVCPYCSRTFKYNEKLADTNHNH
jgi:uncharacterized Zn-finger protein